jgi:hypothetical protein
MSPEQLEWRRVKANAAMKRWYHSSPGNKVKAQARKQRFAAKNREWVTLERRLRTYGLTLDQFHAKYESQDFACAVCKTYLDLGDVHIDHNHSTGRARGLMCRGCNTGFGMFKESPDLLQAAVSYAARWAS